MSEPKPTYNVRKSKPAPATTPPDLDALLAQDRQQRLSLCQAEIAAALRRHRCILVAAASLTQDGRITTRVVLDLDLGQPAGSAEPPG